MLVNTRLGVQEVSRVRQPRCLISIVCCIVWRILFAMLSGGALVGISNYSVSGSNTTRVCIPTEHSGYFCNKRVEDNPKLS